MEWKTLFVRHIQDRLTFKTYKEKYISKANINKQKNSSPEGYMSTLADHNATQDSGT